MNNLENDSRFFHFLNEREIKKDKDGNELKSYEYKINKLEFVYPDDLCPKQKTKSLIP